MSFSINTNITSLQAQNSLRINQNFQASTINQVTSGLRIVNSGDDAAGLAIANGDRSNEAVLTQGIQNANSGLASLQIADGGMSNISQLLDRARTLATQSASGAFTGDRSVLNTEFQSVLTEVNRQAQAIGLNQGGAFATKLGVFVGGGQASSGVSATDNGTVSIDLSQSTVDASSLGLSGVKASGVAGTDIGAGAGGTSLSSILANSTNSGSVANPGFTSFVIKGPGFDGGGVSVSVNTANLGGTSDLVAAVNSAISAAANGGTQQATALKNANIVASVNTDSTGKQQLTFQSSTTAFQVQAGDRESNALMGNFGTNAVATSTDNNAYTDTTSANALTVSTAAGGGSPITVTLSTTAAGTSKGEIVKELNADAGFQKVGVASLSGNQVVITGTDGTKPLTLGGSLGTALGFSTTTNAPAAGSTGAALNTQVQGANALAANANIYGTDSAATSTVTTGTNDKLSLSVNGNAGTTLTLTGATGESKAQLAADINTQIAGGGVNIAGKISASVVNNHIVLSATHAGDSVGVTTGGAQDASGLIGGLAASTTTTSTTNTATSSDTIKLQFQGSGLTAPVTITLAGTTAGSTTSAQVLADLQSKIGSNSALAGAGITMSSSALGNNLVFTSSSGQQFQVVASGDSTNMLGLGSFQAGAGATSPVDYTAATGSTYSTSSTAGSGAATLEVSLNGNAANTTGAAATQFSVNLSGAGTDATSASQAGTVVLTTGADSLAGSAGAGAAVKIRVDGGATQSITLGNSAGETATQILTALNGGLTGATASYTAAGKLQITSNSTGATSSVEVVNAAQGSDAGLLTALGLTGGTVTHGGNASEANVINQINTAIAGSTTLTSASLQAKDNGSGAITLTSNNGTAFRLNSFGSGDVGFGNTGAAFAGNAQSAAPSKSQYFDAQGADASATMAFSDTLYGSDVQNVTLTAVDAGGAKHSLSVPVQNDPTARSQSIDQTLSTINTALQQSNDSTLNQIVAVKEDTGGAQSIRFLSTVKGFQVSVGSDAGGTGITPPAGNVNTATTVGTGSTADISNISTATAAVNQLAQSVATLGNAQAAVGRGENQFNYAINLANSQLTNLAAAESSIRDANMAAESANLTKAQIQMQAGIAALAQANSAPQQILSLLQGH